MAENTVVKEQLTEEMIEAGTLLTAKLGEMGLSIAAASSAGEKNPRRERAFAVADR